MTKVKQFGLIRSGTNFTRSIMELNYDVEFVGGGQDFDPREDIGHWKHGVLSLADNQDCFTVATVRHPLSWLYAVYRYDFQGEIGFNEWLHTASVKQRWRLNRFIPLWSFATLYYRTRLDCVVRFEDLLKTCETESHLTFNLQRTTEEFQVPEDYVGPHDKGVSDHFKMVKERELSAGYLDVYNAENIEYVCSFLDHNLMERFGYEKTGTLLT